MADTRPHGEQTAEVSLESVAKWLAWADRTTDMHAPDKFIQGADRYWSQHADPQFKGRMLVLAAKLLGVEYITWTEARKIAEVRKEAARRGAEAEVKAAHLSTEPER